MSESQKNPDEDRVEETQAALRAAIVKAVEAELEQEREDEEPAFRIDIHIKSGHSKGTHSRQV